MYGSFFGFSSRPFAAAPTVESYFPAQTIELARQNLIRIIQRAEGPGLVIGAAGVGKSLLCRLLAEYFHDSFNVATLSAATLGTRKALLQSLLYEFSLPYRDMEEGELRLALLDFLQPGHSHQNGALLLMDEADSLPTKLLDELRMITNLVRDGRPRAHLVLAGGPALDERFSHPKLESFNQRLAARCYLEPLTYDETIRYVRSQINTAGADPDKLFTEEALQAIHRASDGIPRLINQVCDHALLLACAGGRSQLDATSIGEAWADLQQLPAPWYDHEAQPPADVEFGELDDLVSDEIEDESTNDVTGHAVDRTTDQPLEFSGAELMTTANVPLSVFDTGWQETFEELDEAVVELTSEENTDNEDRNENQQLSIGDFDLSSQIQQTAETASQEAGDTESLAADLFGGAFDEEEVVIDRLASLEIESFRGRPRVVAQESHDLHQALSEFTPTIDAPTPSQPSAPVANTMVPYRVTTPDDERIAVEQEWEMPTQVASPLFEYTVVDTAVPPPTPVLDLEQAGALSGNASDNSVLAAGDAEVAELGDAAFDDRDIIIVEEQTADANDAQLPGVPTPPLEYQELFAQLRKV